MSRSNYVELRSKSNFSFLTGASHPEELIVTALKKGIAGMALTDQNGVYGMPRGYKIARDHPEFRYITGSEILFYDHPPVHLLCQTRAAYSWLCRLLTQLKSGHPKALGAMNFADFLQFLSSAPKEFLCLPRTEFNSVVQLESLIDLFGRENVTLPLTLYLDGHDQKRVAHLRELSQRFDLPLVASNDVEYHTKSRKIIQDVLISIRETQPLDQVGFKLRPNAERYILSADEMCTRYSEFLPAVRKTIELAERCIFSPSELRYRYPSEWIPEGFNGQSYLEHLVWTRAPIRYANGMSDRVRKQLEHELKLIDELKFADYFLTIYDIVEFAQKENILCQGRGSAANSVVCYVLGITAIDPVQMELLFERFISVERGEPPDIDIDFEHERREEVLQYIYKKYGRHRAGMVSAVITYGFRSALREVSKAFGLAVGTLSAKQVEIQFDDLIKKRLSEKNNENGRVASIDDEEKLRTQIETLTEQLKGFPRHLSIHSGGFTLSADPLTDIVPIEPARMEGRTIVQWDKYDLDTLGLIKVDVLSLGMLSCLRKALALVNKKLYELPIDDQATYDMIGRCETVGVFQIESRAQMSMLGRLQPRNFYDLVVEVAIVRPGPIIGKMVHPYLRRRQGLETITYPNATVERILGRTLGIPLFQEQIMKLAIELAEFTPGEADQLRKCINAWRTSASIKDLAGRLMSGLMKSGLSREFAEQIFEHIKGFSHYGFPESHAASFALLAYASCYLKCHHPAEFACSLVNSQPMGFYRADTILYEAIRNNVTVLPVSISKSEWDCTIEAPNTIRLGFRLVKGISENDVKELIRERETQTFKSLADFTKRSCLKKDVLRRLALAGRFAEFDQPARGALWAILEYQHLFRDEGDKAQLNIFDQLADQPRSPPSESEASPTPPSFQFPEPSPFESIQNDYSAYSMSSHGHPMIELRKCIKRLPKTTSKYVRTLPTGTRVQIAGLTLIRQMPPTAKGVCFATLEDEFGFMDLVLWKNVYEKFRDVFLNNCFIMATVEVQHEGHTVSLLVEDIKPVRLNTNETQQAILQNAKPSQYFYG